MKFLDRFRQTTRCVLTLASVAYLVGCGGGGQSPILGSANLGSLPTVTWTSPANTSPIASNIAINSVVSATFSKLMTESTLTTSSFALDCVNGGSIATTLSYDVPTRTATLHPTSVLASTTTCTATINTDAKDSTGLALLVPYIWSFSTAAAADTTAPTVIAITPLNNAGSVSVNTNVNVSFSESMAPSTVTASTMTLRNTTLNTAVTGTVLYAPSSNTAVFTPTLPTPLANNTLYTVTLSTAVTDLAGNPLASTFTSTFTTAALPDTTRPTVTVNFPADAATSVANNTAISATFSEDMTASSIDASSFTLTNMATSAAVTGTVGFTPSSRTATFTPTSPNTLANNTLFTAKITTVAKDLANNTLAADFVWTFTTSNTGDTIAPTVTLVSPLNGVTGVCLTKSVTATFSEAMAPASITTSNFTLTNASVSVPGTVTYDAPSKVATFVPTNPTGFAPNTNLVATVTTGVTDLAANPLASAFSWNFTTGTQACLAPVNLRTIAAFGSFGGGAGVTNQGVNTVVNGHLGTTAVCTAITGFHDAVNVYTETGSNIGLVNGTVYCNAPFPGTTATMAIATQGAADALQAYTDLATLTAVPYSSGSLAGATLAPGLYTAPGGSFDITAGDLTLDAQGDPNAVWVFQMGSSLTIGLIGTPRHVYLLNGAQAKNVFWQVGSAARIENGSVMVGTILASAGVTISTAGQTQQTTLTGRAIGLNASVTMVNTTVVAP